MNSESLVANTLQVRPCKLDCRIPATDSLLVNTRCPSTERATINH